jgi:hypothetical protein
MQSSLKLEKVTFYLPQDLRKQLRFACVQHDTTMCSILTDLTEIYVGKPFQPKTQDRRKTRFSKAIAK